MISAQDARRLAMPSSSSCRAALKSSLRRSVARWLADVKVPPPSTPILKQIHQSLPSRDMSRPAWWVRHPRTPTKTGERLAGWWLWQGPADALCRDDWEWVRSRRGWRGSRSPRLTQGAAAYLRHHRGDHPAQGRAEDHGAGGRAGIRRGGEQIQRGRLRYVRAYAEERDSRYPQYRALVRLADQMLEALPPAASSGASTG
jgi:hypothetical protein